VRAGGLGVGATPILKNRFEASHNRWAQPLPGSPHKRSTNQWGRCARPPPGSAEGRWRSAPQVNTNSGSPARSSRRPQVGLLQLNESPPSLTTGRRRARAGSWPHQPIAEHPIRCSAPSIFGAGSARRRSVGASESLALEDRVWPGRRRPPSLAKNGRFSLPPSRYCSKLAHLRSRFAVLDSCRLA